MIRVVQIIDLMQFMVNRQTQSDKSLRQCEDFRYKLYAIEINIPECIYIPYKSTRLPQNQRDSSNGLNFVLTGLIVYVFQTSSFACPKIYSISRYQRFLITHRKRIGSLLNRPL